MKPQIAFSRFLLCCSLALLFALGVSAQTTPEQSNRWEAAIQAFETADKEAFPPQDAALFVGSSSIRFWTSLAQDFPEISTIGRGFGGSQMADSAHFADRIVIPYRPRLVVVYAGGNDLNAGKSPAQVLESCRDFAAKVHAALPKTRIAFVSINPSRARWKQNDKVIELNQLVRDFTLQQPHLAFINSYDGLLGPDGQPQSELLRADGLHLNAAGYAKWLELLKPSILKLYEAAP